MPLNIKDSINNLLANITQEQVDIWCENQKEEKVSVKEFIKGFSNYSNEGLVSLITAFSMSKNMDEENNNSSR
jgi:hypothetical protein|tara:strand:- start:967 stop:1185 length:219 start_codon:yes stop_codon:yes gene_type:complete